MRKTPWQVLDGLRTCVATQLVETSRPVCNLPIIWGSAPLPAQRCDCQCADGGEGEGWIRYTALTNVPGPGRGTYTNCPSPGWDAQVEVGVWRCALTLDEAGNPPSDDDYDAHTQLMLDDMRALMQAWECCTWWKENRADRVLNQVVPSGPAGGCVGVIASGMVRLNRCLCPGGS